MFLSNCIHIDSLFEDAIKNAETNKFNSQEDKVDLYLYKHSITVELTRMDLGI
jgi:transcription elongation factor